MTDPQEPIRVLVVDDEPAIREALRALLELEPDIDCVGVASSAQDAITLAEEFAPDVTVLDIRLPGGGGQRVADELRQKSPDTELLAFSAFGDRESMAGMRSHGAAAYLAKGAPNQEVVDTIRMLGSRARRR
ncbi:response regulator [Thermocrispum municipale]|jgi:DNA-binding NarL/FixJ family response regulator|uniref:response regulator n=1 Tax=Thermocrispum municipale TaxID=37926 RepID=UPI0003FB7BC1|nr:response regulator transcription factor [Thermocrispum municipale]